MSLFDSLRNRVPSEPPTPEQLCALLINAVSAKDAKRLADLCNAHRNTILSHYEIWRKIPENIRRDPKQIQRYAAMLLNVANYFAQQLDHPELLQSVLPPPESNPVNRWIQKLQEAQRLSQQLRYREAAKLLEAMLPEIGGHFNSEIPKIFGTLATCYLNMGETEKAIRPAEVALQLCKQLNDIEGIIAYLGNLYETYRYLGRPEAAARCADLLAQIFEKDGRLTDAAAYRKQARIVLAGEPLNRVVVQEGGREYEHDELTPHLRHAKFFLKRNRISLEPAKVLTNQGMNMGEQGKYEEALAAFQEAKAADPFDPHPRYQEGLTLLHLRRYEEATESFAETEKLAPAWFQCRADLWIAQQLALKKLTHEVFIAIRSLEDGPQSAKEKIRIAEANLASFPDCAPLHLHHGKNLSALGKDKEAEAAYRKGLAVADEPDVKTRLLVQLGNAVKHREERIHLWQEAVSLNGNLVAAAIARIALLVETPAPAESLASLSDFSSSCLITQGAGWWIRAQARIVDMALFLAVSILARFVTGVLGLSGLAGHNWPSPTELSGWFLTVLGAILYHSICEGLYGASLGKLMCNLCVLSIEGKPRTQKPGLRYNLSVSTKPCGFVAALVRNLGFLLDSLFLGLVGFYSMSDSSLQQRYGDKWGGTVVVQLSQEPAILKKPISFFLLAFTIGLASWVIVSIVLPIVFRLM